MAEDDIVFLDTVTAPPGSGYTDANFEDKKFMATSVPTATTITVTMDTNAGGTTNNVGSCRAQTYYSVGPAQQLGGYGWGTGQWAGTSSGPATTTLATGLAADAGVTSVVLASSAAGAEGQWTGGNNVRFRYGTPEKIGGWDQLGEHKLTGAGRALHHF